MYISGSVVYKTEVVEFIYIWYYNTFLSIVAFLILKSMEKKVVEYEHFPNLSLEPVLVLESHEMYCFLFLQ